MYERNFTISTKYKQIRRFLKPLKAEAFALCG